MWSISEVKERGKAAFKANYWYSVLCAFILSLLLGGTSLLTRYTNQQNQSLNEYNQQGPYSSSQAQVLLAAAGIIISSVLILYLVSFLLKIFVFNPLQVGCFGFFEDNVKNGNADLGSLKTGFHNYGRTFITLLLRDIFLFLWCLLLIFPAFIKAYSYRMVPFIIRDNPELSATEAITRSRKIMNGNKWNAFVFDLSYLGWYILGALTLGLVNIFWTEPYRQNANAALYLSIKDNV